MEEQKFKIVNMLTSRSSFWCLKCASYVLEGKNHGFVHVFRGGGGEGTNIFCLKRYWGKVLRKILIAQYSVECSVDP